MPRRAVDAPWKSLDRHRWQLCVNTWLSGEHKHTLTRTHRGRSRVGTGCKKEPLICRKPHFYLLRANTTIPPLWLIHPSVSTHAHTHSLQSTSHLNHLNNYHHTYFHFSSPPLVLNSIHSLAPGKKHYTFSKAQKQTPLAGKRSTDYWAQLLEDHFTP